MNLLEGFLDSAVRFPSRPALIVDGEQYSYGDMAAFAAGVGNAISKARAPQQNFVGVIGLRSLSAFAGVLGALFAGKTYVPLHPAFPPKRTLAMCRLSGIRTLIAGREAFEALRALLEETTERMDVILPEAREAPAWAASQNHHNFVTAHELRAFQSRSIAPGEFAYLLFTSGSTGEPKGVPVSHANACSYVRYICDRYDINKDDRFSQNFDLTFDLSVHDMFVCWARGACLCCVPPKSVMAPGKFIRDQELTMWFSVPSTAGRMLELRMLRAGSFPTLRTSLFCGEPLPAEYAAAWQRAAPQSIVENLYGPTEATIAITAYRWEGDASATRCVNGIVPIGIAFEGQKTCLIDAARNPLGPESEGELCLSGSQVTGGYLNNPAKTRSQFVTLDSDTSTIWYRTGDHVREDKGGCLHYLGRIDQQIKIRGFRADLQEIEHVLRQATKGAGVVAVPWPERGGTAEGVVGFIRAPELIDSTRVLELCREVLPPYMVPTSLRFVSDLPINPSGKIDRKALRRQLDAE